jgi:3-deoxy-D-manno-octulosonic-acid transferase
MLLPLYRLATHLGGPLIALHLRRRVRLGKEDPARLGERFGKPGLERPDGALIWFHAASVGEALAALPLIEALLKARKALHILVTTGTVSSARLMAKRLPERAVHQFVPVDRGVAWRSFLRSWRPDLACLIESEVWPNLVVQAEALGVPLVVINGRMSKRSFRRWRRVKGTAARLFSSFELCLARNDGDARRFHQLGASDVRSLGDLKHAAPLLPVDEDALAAWRRLLEGRTVWLAASTHHGEEEAIVQVHKALASDFPGLLTIVVPRHPERGDDLAAEIGAAGLEVARRSRRMLPASSTDIYLGDSLGELGLFYRLAPVAFIGGSLVPHGGQNPLEAARLDCALLFGPHTGNFDEITGRLERKGGARRVADGDELRAALDRLFRDRPALTAMAVAARRASVQEDAVIERILSALSPHLDRTMALPVPTTPGPAVEIADAGP